MKVTYPCPACGFLVFEEEAGSYDICPICGWEDDGIQLVYPALKGGANQDSLYEHQLLWIKGIPETIRERNGYNRDPEWRPLRMDELGDGTTCPKSGQEYFNAACTLEAEYYWRKK